MTPDALSHLIYPNLLLVDDWLAHPHDFGFESVAYSSFV